MTLRSYSSLSFRSVISLLLITGCASEIRTPQSTALNWTTENRLSSTDASEGSSGDVGLSSLDALRRGESTATPQSSPLKEIYFEFDRYEVRADARQTLDANAQWLRQHPTVRVEIEGHCDERGSNEYNMGLAAKRAQAARDYLESIGIAAHRMSTVGYGEELPVCSEHTESCWQRNRRGRFVIASGSPAL